tara:strand:- start:73 stop:885 length:813 start_codon:yes stop_codon:yes gene_type:complete
MNLTKIAFHGVPRSGTSWVGAIFDSSKNVIYRNQPLFSYAFKSLLYENSSSKEIDQFFRKISKSKDNFITQFNEKEKGLIPCFEKEDANHIVYKEARYHNILTNMLQKDKEVKVIGIIRNPKSVISSWVNAPREFDLESWDIMKEWRKAPSKNKDLIEEFYGYDKWKEVANLFISLKEKYPKRFYLINYKDLLNDTERVVNDLFNFCGLRFEKQTKTFLQNDQKKDNTKEAYSVYRVNQVDDKWKKKLPKEIIKAIDIDLMGTNLEKYLY